MSKRKSSPRRTSYGRRKTSGFQYNTIIQYQYFEMLDRIRQESLQPDVQINIAKAINMGLLSMGSSEFSQFDYNRFVEEVMNNKWENHVVAEYLDQAINKVLRLKYEYVDKPQEQFCMEYSIRSNFTFGQYQNPNDTFDSNSRALSGIQTPELSRIMVSSLYERNPEETKSKNLENWLGPKFDSNIFNQVQSEEEGQMIRSQLRQNFQQ